jgi:hypothetical protein
MPLGTKKAKLVDPVLFSKHYGIDQASFQKKGLIEPILNADTKLFIDPLLLASSQNEFISKNGLTQLKLCFSNIIKLVAVSKHTTDAAWKAAQKQLNLSESPETCLGYGAASINGSSRPISIKNQILSTTKEIIMLGEENPEIISLMGMLEEGVGADTVSDLTTNMIKESLANITANFCNEYGVPTQNFSGFGNMMLPLNPYKSNMPVLLVPIDVLRPLPIANDRSEVSRVIYENERLRDQVNRFLADITKASVTDMKQAVRNAALSSKQNITEILEAMTKGGRHYDPNEDILGYFNFRTALAAQFKFEGGYKSKGGHSVAELLQTVEEITNQFVYLIEKNNLWEMLWHNGQPRRERAAQLLYFAIADSFCKSNNIDISPETNAGGGPVDFKFSQGYEHKVVVEIKLSTGTVVHGFEKQIEIYKEASRTKDAFFVVVDVGGMGKKLDTILHLDRKRKAKGEPSPKIFVADASPKESASKRRK